ncbi:MULTISPECIES: hypothetical protein [unclassified Pseudonocardia]|jgi:hypothetical protein|uniref:hypothetical protein n=1 Tax=unclassified Pseudonocardia TaxID=2619320 RepID=UPI0001FFEE1C|nr:MULTISPECIES: hypothetical protein [unclassified Pseudonocardia]ALE72939.1 hypothetical protein FRP1_07180 [Pseudonocardia sp. EC080625-04]ALL76265.1 hypothetical protein AD006_14795 [Pseudonocardia sp. EC080610-09]ALL83292.1 hypothetical protein AD017_22620 [Pseudonocardia sp. EC080619-01]OLM19508.1 hypothetical protein Ae707Ps1_3767 [Pseudonocardia sp. Ae707_Ps1]
MSITADRPTTFAFPASSGGAADIASRMPRRHTVVTGDGMEGVMQVATALQTCGRTLREFCVDVREGVAYSSVTCTMSMTPSEADEFETRMLAMPFVLAVDPY